MSRKRKFEQNLPPALRFINNLKYKDLKRECVIRGMLFEDVIEGTLPTLSGWLIKHFDEGISHELLDEFDDWQEDLIKEAMEKKGEDPSIIIHPSLRLGYIAERDEEGNVTKRKRARTLVGRKRKKRERTADGIFQGTKKAYTFQLQQEGYSKQEVLEMVKNQFPDAAEKSIGIWFNKSKKIHKK
jgi:hypothetical protein